MNCPNCSAPVTGTVCEYCGSDLSDKGNVTIHITNHYYNAQPRDIQPVQKRKRKTWLWVLGWIFLFPVPLMILLLRKKNMNPFLKLGIIAAAWILYFLLALTGNSTQEPLQTACVLQGVVI